MRPGEINIDPIEGEFFTTEALGSLNHALVREAIQNSLDAAVDGGPVFVRFSFHNRAKGLPDSKDTPDSYLEKLDRHLKARHSGLQDIPSLTEGFDYILIEDYGTRGLQGDIFQYDDLDDDKKRNDFYYFWRNIGRTRKENTDPRTLGARKNGFSGGIPH